MTNDKLLVMKSKLKFNKILKDFLAKKLCCGLESLDVVSSVQSHSYITKLTLNYITLKSIQHNIIMLGRS
jgi:hypothetical protein